MNTLQSRAERVKWFTQARFGMFIHWGLYAIPGRGEWVMSTERIPVSEYEPYMHEFNPVHYDPTHWAKRAKAAGMQYVILTAKHHDGYCLFDSKLTDYKSTNSPIGRDLVREFVEAVRAEGLKVGLYYSIMDWHHPDFPKWGDLNHPMRDNPAYKDEKINFDNYLKYMHGQVEELVTNYGKIDILWFDYAYGDLRGEAWKATELVRMVRRHQPHVIIDNRLETSGEGFGSAVEAEPAEFCGDFVSPEQIIPPEGIRNVFGDPVPWELCTTMNNNWGYNPSDLLYKPASMLIRKLVECVSKGGNMILNIGPDATGRVDKKSWEILDGITEWMSRNSASVIGCDNANRPKPEWGWYTQNGNKLYAHVLEAPIGPLALTGVSKDEIVRIRRLADGAEVTRGESWITASYAHIPFISFGDLAHFSYPLPDPIDTVLEITLKEDNK